MVFGEFANFFRVEPFEFLSSNFIVLNRVYLGVSPGIIIAIETYYLVSNIFLRVSDFDSTKQPGPGAQSALRALARSGMKIGRIGKHFLQRMRLSLYVFFRGRHPHPHRQHPPQGWSPRSPFVVAYSRSIELEHKHNARI